VNERLDHLMYQAGLTAQGCWDELDAYDREAITKFAELIIKKCAMIGNNAHDGGEYPGPMIKEYFGVDS